MPNHQNPLEFYETPRAHVYALMQHVVVTGTCFEPCVGSGAIITHMTSAPSQGEGRIWMTNDIDRRWGAGRCMDATDTDLWSAVQTKSPEGRIDWTVTNTPFSVFLEIAEQALIHSSMGVALYGRISINEPLKEGQRAKFLSLYPPKQIIFLPRYAYRRSPKTGKWTTDSMSCCWMVWQRNLAGTWDPGDRQQIRYGCDPALMKMLDDDTAEYRKRMDKLTRYRGPK